MDKAQISDAIKKVRESSPKRKFNQTFDIILNLKEINLKKPEQKVDVFVPLPNSPGKKRKVCALIDDSMFTEAKTVFDRIILKSDFKNIDKKEIKKIAQEYDYFIAQANIMSEVASTFGKVLGTRGKMPNPKSGAIVPPKAALKPIYERFQKVVRIITKNEATLKCPVGTEAMKDEELAANIEAVYNAAVHALPGESGNVREVLLKLTMGAPVKVGN